MSLMSGISNMMLLYSVDEESNKMKKLSRKASDKKCQEQSRRTSNSYVGMLASSGMVKFYKNPKKSGYKSVRFL